MAMLAQSKRTLKAFMWKFLQKLTFNVILLYSSSISCCLSRKQQIVINELNGERNQYHTIPHIECIPLSMVSHNT